MKARTDTGSVRMLKWFWLNQYCIEIVGCVIRKKCICFDLAHKAKHIYLFFQGQKAEHFSVIENGTICKFLMESGNEQRLSLLFVYVLLFKIYFETYCTQPDVSPLAQFFWFVTETAPLNDPMIHSKPSNITHLRWYSIMILSYNIRYALQDKWINWYLLSGKNTKFQTFSGWLWWILTLTLNTYPP